MRPGGPPAAGGTASAPTQAPDRRRPTEVHDGLVELELLSEHGLITDEKYRPKRVEILGRL